MIREIVKIDRDLCDGCGLCIPNCHEGALQIIDGKACLVSELMCDGLGACLGHCPKSAMTIEKREAIPYDEKEVMKEIVNNGKNVVVAHLKHLKEHNENEYFAQGMEFLEQNKESINFNINEIKEEMHKSFSGKSEACGCPGSAAKVFNKTANIDDLDEAPSALTHWPVQMHLINPAVSYFQNSDIVLAADCVAYSMGNFHSKYLKEKTLAIMCPKLDNNQNIYVDKIVSLIDDAKVNTITVMMMEVPCCGGLLRFVKEAQTIAKRKVPVKKVIVSVSGEVLKEEWV